MMLSRGWPTQQAESCPPADLYPPPPYPGSLANQAAQGALQKRRVARFGHVAPPAPDSGPVEAATPLPLSVRTFAARHRVNWTRWGDCAHGRDIAFWHIGTRAGERGTVEKQLASLM